jgi:hypothetical protein
MRALISLLLPLAIGLTTSTVAPLRPPPIGRAPDATAARTVLAPDSGDHWVAFHYTPGNQISFVATLDGAPVSAIIDTGLSYSVLSRAYVEQHGLKVTQEGSATVVGGAVPIGWAATRSLSFGGLSRQGGEIAVADVPAMAAGGGPAVDLLIGPDLLADYALDVDFAQHRLRLLPSGQLPFRGSSAPLKLSPLTGIYLTEGRLDGTALRPLVLDTGDGSMLTLTQSAWRAAEPQPPAMSSAMSYGLGGAVETGLAIVPSVELGDLVARNVEVRVEPDGGFSQAVGAQGRVGTGLLQRYRALLDPRAGRLVLAPGPDADRAPVRSTSGLLLGLDDGRLRVVHVMRNSPAAAAGWRTGDLICSVDGRGIPADYLDSPIAGWTTGAPGRTVSLGMCDGTTRRLTLRQFY